MSDITGPDGDFEGVFAQFDPANTGYINTRDFLNIIDELDSLQPENSEPIMTEEQRESALQVVDASIAMSKSEVLSFLRDLGVTVGDLRKMEQSPRRDHGMQGNQTIPSPLSGARPRSRVMPGKVERVRRPPRTNTEAVSISTVDFSPRREDSVLSDASNQIRESNLPRRTTSSPLAQSTPHKDSPYAKENLGTYGIRPKSTPTNGRSKSMFAATGEGAFSPPSMLSSRSFSGAMPDSAEVQRLQDDIKVLQDRERASERSIAASEHQIHHLEQLLQEAKDELAKSHKMASELRSTGTTADHNIQTLEREVEGVHGEMIQWQEKHSRVKKDLDSQAIELARLESMCQEKAKQLESVEAQISGAESDRRSWMEERQSLQAQISGLEIQCDKLVYTETSLAETLELCNQRQRQIEQLTHDLEQVKKASLRSSSSSKVSVGTAESQTDEKRTSSKKVQTTPEDNLSPAAEVAFARIQESQAGGPTSLRTEDETIKQHYATLTSELGLQRNLINKMIKMKAAMKKSKGKVRFADQQATSQIPPAQAGKDSTKTAMLKTQGSNLTWPILILYSLVFVLLGYILASRRGIAYTSGVSYAELKRWERANSIEYLLDHHGVLGHNGNTYRWWEGGPRWVEKAGYWLEERLRDDVWPS